MKNKKVLAFVSTIAVIFLGIFVIVSINTNKQKADTPISESHSYSSKWVQSNDSERIALMSKTMQKLPDVETAKKNVPFKVKVPKDTKNKKLLATFISKDENRKLMA